MGFNYTAVDQSNQVARARIGGGTCLVTVKGEMILGTLTIHPTDGLDDCPYYQRPGIATVS